MPPPPANPAAAPASAAPAALAVGTDGPPEALPVAEPADPFSPLLDRLAAGDHAALDTLYRLLHPACGPYVRRLTGRDDAFADDVTHDAFLTLIRRPPVLTTPPLQREHTTHALPPWFARMLCNAAIDRLRSESRRAGRERRAAAEDRQPPSGWAEVHEELQRLDHHEHLLLLARFGHGRTLPGLAAALATTVGTLHGRIRRALAGLAPRPPDSTPHADPTPQPSTRHSQTTGKGHP